MTQQDLATAWQAYRAANAAFMAQSPEERGGFASCISSYSESATLLKEQRNDNEG